MGLVGLFSDYLDQMKAITHKNYIEYKEEIDRNLQSLNNNLRLIATNHEDAENNQEEIIKQMDVQKCAQILKDYDETIDEVRGELPKTISELTLVEINVLNFNQILPLLRSQLEDVSQKFVRGPSTYDYSETRVAVADLEDGQGNKSHRHRANAKSYGNSELNSKTTRSRPKSMVGMTTPETRVNTSS
jgi:hypothetical protein